MLIVDANNVLHAAGDGRRPDAIARLMASVLASRYALRQIVLVCDGSPGRLSPGAQAMLVRLLAGGSGRARIAYSGPEREADDLIEDLIDATADPARLIVVSSDARLASAAFRAGAVALDAREFLAHIEKDRTKAAARADRGSDPLDPHSVAWWMDYFGMGTASPVARAPRTLMPSSPLPDAPPAPARREGQRAPVPPTDWMTEAMRMWPGQIAPGDLNMEQWLPEKKARRRKPPSGERGA